MWQPADRPPAVDVASDLLRRNFPNCLAAFLAGSIVRGEATATSDLDLMIIVPDDHPSYRESLRAAGWPVEIFVQTLAVHRYFSQHDAARRNAITSHMVCEGIVLRNRDGWADGLKASACALLAAGPAPLTARELSLARYFISDLVDDLIDARPEEAPFVAWELAQSAVDLILDRHGRWRGRGKWLLRSLRRFDPALAERLSAALHQAANGNPAGLLAFTADALEPVGGRLWEGFYLDAPELPE